MTSGPVFDKFTQFQEQVGIGSNTLNGDFTTWGPQPGPSTRTLTNPPTTFPRDDGFIRISGGNLIFFNGQFAGYHQILQYNYGNPTDFRNLIITLPVISGNLFLIDFARITLTDGNNSSTINVSQEGVNSGKLEWSTQQFTGILLQNIVSMIIDVVPPAFNQVICGPLTSIIIPSGGSGSTTNTCGY